MKTKPTHPWRRDKIGQAISTLAARAQALAGVRRRAMELAVGGHRPWAELCNLPPKRPMKKSTKPEVKKTGSPRKIKLIKASGKREEISRGSWMPVERTFRINDIVLSVDVDSSGGFWLKIHP